MIIQELIARFKSPENIQDENENKFERNSVKVRVTKYKYVPEVSETYIETMASMSFWTSLSNLCINLIISFVLYLLQFLSSSSISHSTKQQYSTRRNMVHYKHLAIDELCQLNQPISSSQFPEFLGIYRIITRFQQMDD